MSSLLVLEFVERDDFAAELNIHGVKNVRLEITSQSGAPRGAYGNAPHTMSAVATALVTINERHSAIVRWETPILITDSLTLRMDSKESRNKMFDNFERVRAELEALGFNVSRGQWKAN